MSIDLRKIQKTPSKDVPPPAQGKVAQSNSLTDFLQRDIKLFGTGLNWQQKEAFFSELAVLLQAGLDIRSALSLMQDNDVKPKVQETYTQVYDTLIRGASLADAMDATQQFSIYELSSVRIAEESGKLLPVLERLAAHFAKSIQLKRLLLSALSYPVLVLIVAGFSLLFLLNFLVPLFGDIYARLDQDLPGITQFIIDFSNRLNQTLPYLILVNLIVLGIAWYFRKTPFFRRWSAAIITRLPLFGPLIQKVFLSRFAHGLSFLLQSSVPLNQALGLVKDMVSFYPISEHLPQVQQQIFNGKGLYESLESITIVPGRMRALIKIGEETNHLPQMLAKIAHQYDDEVEQKTKLLGSLLEPLLIVFLAITVGIVLVSMYLPIFKLVTNFGL